MRRITLLTNPDLCNLHCPLCFLNQCGVSGRFGEMSIEVARAAIERYASERDEYGNRLLREVIPSTMGEPLLYSKLNELLQVCEAKSLKLNLTTNGSFPGPWGSDSGMERLLGSCSDIKISTLSYETGGLPYSLWSENVERLMRCRSRTENVAGNGLSKVSLQVTLHGQNAANEMAAVEWAKGIVRFAENLGIDRIKWNRVVILEKKSPSLRERFGVDNRLFEMIRQEMLSGALRSSKVKYGGSLFFEQDAGLCSVGGKCDACPFENEVWVWPDGHEDHCPNPERRWGNSL